MKRNTKTALPSDDVAVCRDRGPFDAGEPWASVSAPCLPPDRSGPDLPAPPADLFHRIGQLTRTLHEALAELGYDKRLKAAARSVPDARERLAYIASLTGRAADRVLGAVEESQALQQGVQRDASALLARWHGAAGISEHLAGDTRVFLERVTLTSSEQAGLLHDIMMAQDFHDLTGQLIKRVGEIAHTLEASLVTLLSETASPHHAGEQEQVRGPALPTQGRTDIVRSQAEVDALLGSLGF